MIILSVNVRKINIFRIDPNDGSIGVLSQHPRTTQWEKSRVRYPKATKGSSIAVVEYHDTNGRRHSSIFYQSPELRLREYSFDYSADRWIHGK